MNNKSLEELKGAGFSEEELSGSLELSMELLNEFKEMSNSEDPLDKVKAKEKLEGLKDTLLEKVHALSDEIGLSKEELENIMKDPAAFLSEDKVNEIEEVKTTNKTETTTSRKLNTRIKG